MRRCERSCDFRVRLQGGRDSTDRLVVGGGECRLAVGAGEGGAEEEFAEWKRSDSVWGVRWVRVPQDGRLSGEDGSGADGGESSERENSKYSGSEVARAGLLKVEGTGLGVGRGVIWVRMPQEGSLSWGE